MKKKPNKKKGKLKIDSLKNISLKRISDQELEQIKGGNSNIYMHFEGIPG